MKIDPITIINFADKAFAVETLPANIQTLVKYYNDWRQNEADLQSQLMMTQAAVQQISQQISAAVEQHIKDEADKVVDKVEATVEDAATITEELATTAEQTTSPAINKVTDAV